MFSSSILRQNVRTKIPVVVFVLKKKIQKLKPIVFFLEKLREK